MSMWEVDELLKDSIALIQNSKLEAIEKKNIIWNLENLPDKYEMDAGGFAKSELSDTYSYRLISPYKLGETVAEVSVEQNKQEHIYDWSAFLLNYFSEYFKTESKETSLAKLKTLFQTHNFDNYRPKHATLTIYKDGNQYFDDEQNELIKWFVN